MGTNLSSERSPESTVSTPPIILYSAAIAVVAPVPPFATAKVPLTELTLGLSIEIK